MASSLYSDQTVVFYDPTYPQAPTEKLLHQLLPDTSYLVDAADLSSELTPDCKLLISFHGPYFPKSAWQTLLRFLERGGNIAIFGGMPFTRPLTDDQSIEPEQDAYTRQIYLGPFFEILTETYKENGIRFEAATEIPGLKDQGFILDDQAPGRFWGFYPKMTETSDHPEDTGSAGPLDTLLQPLLFALTTTPYGEEKIATPALLLEHRSGRFRGGRWLISAWEPSSEEDWLLNSSAIQEMLALASHDPIFCEVRPQLACYHPNEIPTLMLTIRSTTDCEIQITITQPESTLILQKFTLSTEASPVQYEQALQLPPLTQPGLYHIETIYHSSSGEQKQYESGFWIWDESLVQSTWGKRLTAGRDYFYQGNEIFPVCGTTYMDSQVQRKYLHLPNPARWDKEMDEMKAAGINLLRTGLWTAWREFIPVAGHANEAFLRALDAFVLTSCKHELQLIFTFFAFYPTLFEGKNPWLDPDAIEAQQDFLALIARRYTAIETLSWDLINEPSFGDPSRIFAQRPIPNYDHFEIAAFQTWLQERYTLDKLQLRWRVTPADLPDWSHVLPPQAQDYTTYIRETNYHSKLKVADYTRFSQDSFVSWAHLMVKAIRAGGSQALIGIGQDESGSRIAPQFYATAVDYTTTHPWWNIDDLLWDMLMEKTPQKPNLIQEVGVMLARDVDGRPWRSEEANAHLLERKLITGLIANSAGLIQWLWHTNSYMTSDNENSIGLVRADGSAKPELIVMKEFATLQRALQGNIIEQPLLPAVWLVIPYSQWYVHPDLGIKATQQAVRTLGYELGIIPQLIGEPQLTLELIEREKPRLIIVPAVQLFEPDIWYILLDYAHNGGTVLISGITTRDTHNLSFDPGIDEEYQAYQPRPVARYEELHDGAQTHQVLFADEKISYVKKAHNQFNHYQYGNGHLYWSGLPLELASNNEICKTIYQRVLTEIKLADQRPDATIWETPQPLLMVRKPIKDGYMILFVSDMGNPEQITLSEGIQITIAPQRAGAVLIKHTGQTLQTFGGVTVQKSDSTTNRTTSDQ